MNIFSLSFSGVSTLRTAASGDALPDAWQVAKTLRRPGSVSKTSSPAYLTVLAPVWAQFILDDISRPVTYAGWSSLQSPLLSFLSIFFILNSAMALVAANLIFCQG